MDSHHQLRPKVARHEEEFSNLESRNDSNSQLILLILDRKTNSRTYKKNDRI